LKVIHYTQLSPHLKQCFLGYGVNDHIEQLQAGQSIAIHTSFTLNSYKRIPRLASHKRISTYSTSHEKEVKEVRRPFRLRIIDSYAYSIIAGTCMETKLKRVLSDDAHFKMIEEMGAGGAE
jgi:hypothetical protein